MRSNFCTARFLKQADFSGSFPQGSSSAAPHPPTLQRRVPGASLAARGAGALCRARRHSPGSDRERNSSLECPVGGQGQGRDKAGTRQGGILSRSRGCQLWWRLQRAQRPFPALPGAVARAGLFQAWLLCSAEVQPTREGLGSCCMLGTAVLSF